MKELSLSRTTRRAVLVLALAVILSLFAPFALQTAAAQAGTGARVETAVLSVRSGPGAGFDRVATAAQGDIVILLGRTGDSSWVKVRLPNDIEGWVTTYYLTPLAGPFNTLPVLENAEPQALVISEVLNVRGGPGFDYEPIGVIYGGTYVNVLGRDAAGAWLLVRSSDGVRGWVASGNVTANVSFASLPVTTEMPAATTEEGTEAETVSSVVGTETTTNDFLWVGSGPRNASDTVTFLDGDVPVILLGRNEAGDWLYIRFHGGSLGWAETPYINVNIDILALPILEEGQTPSGENLTAGVIGAAEALAQNTPVASGGEQPVPVPSVVGAEATTISFVWVGSGPRNESNTVTFLDGGEVVKLLARNELGDWLYIRFHGDSLGWSETPYYATAANVNALPVLTEGDTPSGEHVSNGVIGAAEALALATPTTTSGPAPTATTPATSITTTGPTATVTAPVLNVRAGAGPGYESVAQVAQGEVVVMVGRDDRSAWIQIALPGTNLVGWASSYYLQPNTSVLGLPVTDQFQAAGQVTAAVLNVRSGPGVWYPVISVVQQGQYVTLTGRLPDSSWLKVLINGQEGWIGSAGVVSGYPLNSLPVFQIQ